jgi:thiol-disulfide isomerase/thioredoxin
MDSTQVLQLALCEKTFGDQSMLNATEKQFFETERSAIRYEAANQKLNFPAYHGYMTGNRGYTAPPEYYTFLDAIPLVDENAIASSRYLEFLSSYVDYNVKAAMAAAPESDGNELRHAFIDSHWKGYLRDYLHAKRIHQWLDAGSMDVALGIYTAIKPTMTTPGFIALLDKTIAAHQQLAPGKPAPHFAARDLHGNIVDLSAFQGKVIYIDIWATWCGPCLGEIPAMEKLIHDMEGKDVVFLGVSVDENEDAWKKMLRDKNMKGAHIIAPGNFESTVAKAYQVRGIPHYVLIDKYGNIANANAPRPGYVKEELERLLKM